MGGSLVLALLTFIIVYIITFKNDFKEEDINKVTPVVAVVFLVVLILNVLTMLTK